MIRVADSAQASDIKQLNDSGIKIEGVVKESGTNKENWDEWRASLMEQQGRIQEGTGKPKIFISSRLVDLDEEGNEFNFLVKELENLRWEEMKGDLASSRSRRGANSRTTRSTRSPTFLEWMRQGREPSRPSRTTL